MIDLYSKRNPGYLLDESKKRPDKISEAINKLSSEERELLDSKLVKLVRVTQEFLGEERVPFEDKDVREPVILVKRNIFDSREDFAYPMTVYVPLNQINVYVSSKFYGREAEKLAELYEQETGEKWNVKELRKSRERELEEKRLKELRRLKREKSKKKKSEEKGLKRVRFEEL